MALNTTDWLIIALYGVVALWVGVYFARRAGKGRQDFFLSGRQLPWWLLGTSMVATTFSTDTPNLVTDIVRTGGVSNNWLWWAFILTGMCTVFFYARLWRRSGALTDMAFYELRYSGKPAAFLRGFRAIYLGVFFNVVIMASVTLAAIKIGGVLLGLDKYTTVLICGAITAVYSATSGLWGVVVTDLLLFVVAMVGSLAAAYYALERAQVDGLGGLFTHPAVADKLSFLPDLTNWEGVLTVLVVPLAVQWWSTWYPGAEPGGGGYVAQRMLAARNEQESLRATLWFNVAHYALRPWPWIIVALCSIIVYPTVGAIQEQFPHLDPSIVKNDLAYPAMLVALPHGLLGLVVASLAAAYMSTISTHLNWGSSYVVDDFYRRFFVPQASERHYVLVARLSTVLLVVLSSMLSFWLENALDTFQIMLQIGAGTGLIFLLRWFWWRINAWSEISAMFISFAVAVYFRLFHESLGLDPLSPTLALVLGVAVTTFGWLLVTMLTPPTEKSVLENFYKKIRLLGPGWSKAVGASVPKPEGSLSAAFLCWFLGCLAVYAAIFATGYLLYGRNGPAMICFALLAIATMGLFRYVPRVEV